MQNNKLKKLSGIFLLIFVFFSLFASTVNADVLKPTIRNITPTSGKEGSEVKITGSNLSKSEVYFGNIQAKTFGYKGTTVATLPNGTKVPIADSEELIAIVPVGAKTGYITAKNRATAVLTLDANSPSQFTVVAAADLPPQPSDLRWFHIGAKNQGFPTLVLCEEDALNYKKINQLPYTPKCEQKSLAKVRDNSAGFVYDISAAPESPKHDTTYDLLAPIGEQTQIDTNNIGEYFNIMFKIAIALCAALAVIMIIIAGVQYMGDESVFGKTEAKSKIFSAIGGLFIALGAFALLNTIDPALTGKDGLTIDQVSAVIGVRNRADDPDFINNIDSFDTSNITINTSDYSDPSFLGYLAHQQGTAGASAILWSAKKGYSEVPANNPFAKGDINRNMRSNFPSKSAQKTIGTSTLTPANFLKYWAIKVEAAKRKTSPKIPASIDSVLNKVASETGVSIADLRAMCRIESYKGCTDDTGNPSSITKINSLGYSGLFQMGKGEFEKYKKNGGTILDAYHNTYAATQYLKFNLSGLNKNWNKINS